MCKCLRLGMLLGVMGLVLGADVYAGGQPCVGSYLKILNVTLEAGDTVSFSKPNVTVATGIALTKNAKIPRNWPVADFHIRTYVFFYDAKTGKRARGYLANSRHIKNLRPGDSKWYSIKLKPTNWA